MYLAIEICMYVSVAGLQLLATYDLLLSRRELSPLRHYWFWFRFLRLMQADYVGV